jgi:ABC-2 type transport system ATP-binding protein
MLKIENLCKTYPKFSLKNVSFELPEGYIMGFIGANGAGKTTTLKSILNVVLPDSGTVTIFGKNIVGNEIELKQRIGFMYGEAEYYPHKRAGVIAEVYSRFYHGWDDAVYRGYLDRFDLDESKQIGEFSSGMKVKFALALALSHGADLFIFDEPSSGLDPVARAELLDLFHELVMDGRKSILFSTHITSDLDKCADFVVFIRNGEIIANTTKDDLLDAHALVAGKPADLTEELKSRLVGLRMHAFGFTGLAKKSDLRPEDPVQTEAPNLEDIMVYYDRGNGK